MSLTTPIVSRYSPDYLRQLQKGRAQAFSASQQVKDLGIPDISLTGLGPKAPFPFGFAGSASAGPSGGMVIPSTKPTIAQRAKTSVNKAMALAAVPGSSNQKYYLIAAVGIAAAILLYVYRKKIFR